MAEVYVVPGDGLYVQGIGGAGTLINPGSQISGVAGAYSVSLGARGPAVDTPTGLPLPAGWSPAGVATPMVNGLSRAKLWPVNQAAYNVLRTQWPDSAITVQPGQEANITRQP